jgi:hypothetical protein
MAYGVEIYNSSGQLILSDTTKLTNIIVSGTTTLTSPTTGSGGVFTVVSSSISFPGLTASNTTEYNFWTAVQGFQNTATGNFERVIFNRNTDTFTVEYRAFAASRTITVRWWGIRY